MRIAVMGSGAVGGYFGGLLAKAGLDVSFIARGAHLRALREKGITVRGPGLEYAIPVKASGDPSTLGPVDLVLFCVKSYDTEAAIRHALPMIGADTVILSLQNGIENEERIGAVVGREKVLGGIAYVGSWIAAPGIIEHDGPGRFIFGELAGGTSARVQRLQALFARAGDFAKPTEDLGKAKWIKLSWNAAFNTINALVGGFASALVENSHIVDLAKRTIQEVAAVAAAEGVPLPPDMIDRHMEIARKSPSKTSTLQDVEAGKPLEIDALLGVILRKGSARGIPTPYCFALHALLTQLAARR